MEDVNHAARAHARLSPSGAHRWMACPGSVRLSEQVSEKSSRFANEGTAAHELAQICLQTNGTPGELLGRVIDVSPDNDFKVLEVGAKPDNETRFEVTAEMVENVGIYVDHVRWFSANGYECSVEERVYMGEFVAHMSGTADFLAYSEEHKHLHVIDLKYGAGVLVDPANNPQLMAYGIGALQRYGNRPVEKVTLTIVQPRASHPRGPIRSWETTPHALIEHGIALSKAAEIVADADDANGDDLLWFLTPGEHCGFCPAKGFCPKLRAESLSIAQDDFKPEMATSPDEVAEWLSKCDMVEKWAKAVREFANAEAREGRMPTGYKFVEKRAVRKWCVDADVLVPALRMLTDFTDEQIFAPREVRSVAQIEKAVGKANTKDLLPFISKQSSGLVLAPDADPRPAASFDAKADFAEVEIDD